MNITLDKQIKKYRKEKNKTQEDLANHLGITVQAVSKWERGEGYPDITLLPSISSFFDVSVDDLLGVGEIAKEKRIEEYRDRDHELFCEGKSKARVELMREAQKEFPNDLRILYDLMYALSAYDRNANADEIITLAERILNESTDSKMRGGAIQTLSFTYYYAKGDAEQAKHYADMADFYWCSVNELMPRFLEGDEAVHYCQSNIQELFEMILSNTDRMLFKGKYSHEDSITAYRFVLDCFKLLYNDGNFGFYSCRVSKIYQCLASNYRAIGDIDKMFECLDGAAEYAIRYDTRKDGFYTAFMVNKLELRVDTAVKDYVENDSALLLKHLDNGEFAEFKDDDRMKAITEKLNRYADFGE